MSAFPSATCRIVFVNVFPHDVWIVAILYFAATSAKYEADTPVAPSGVDHKCGSLTGAAWATATDKKNIENVIKKRFINVSSL